MNETKRNLLVGSFVLVAGLALAGLVILFGEQPEVLGGQSYQVLAKFEKLEGITRGIRVSMSGLTVGEVGKLELADPAHPERGVNVALRIFEKFTIPNTAEAVVQSSVIGFGQATFVITFPAGVAAAGLSKDGSAVINGRMAETSIVPNRTLDILEQTVKNIGDLAAALTPVGKDLHELLQRRTIDQVDQPTTDQAERLAGNLSTAIARLDRTLKHFNEVLGDPAVQSNLREAIQNITTASRDLPTITEDLKDLSERFRGLTDDGKTLLAQTTKTVETTNTNIEMTAEKLQGILEQASASMTHINKVTQAIADKEGTIGKFVFDPSLYEELVLTTRRINVAIEGVQVLVETLSNSFP